MKTVLSLAFVALLAVAAQPTPRSTRLRSPQ